ncbi:von Willebrand factor A domain-containing protein 1 [Hyla sarda]|uniref:von Willebrand factor A domain-containing protein 1 n=1 Tax=Hyla sarda TaxID=327740 RepID=UPI0024C3B24D|nr:von Willebrand factor A domain-containing protein 1 [Hyla sarda]
MFVLLVLHSLLSPALGQTIPEADRSSFVPDSEGDLYFLLDSSGSVTYDEFSKVKQFIGDLLQPFKFGPQDVQASVVQISTNPTLEFPLNQYSSSKDVQKAIQQIRQRMGDTNTGKAIDYVKKNLYAEDFGSRGDVPKVLVWMTDGLSTDDISGPMKLLKDKGVSVFIISTTGRGNFQDLSAAASDPNEKYLKFVDKDDLGIITKELRDSIIELIQAKRLHAQNITTSSFQLTWPRLLSKDTGHYVLEYAPVADLGKKLQHNLHGDQTRLEITGLTADTTYAVTLYPESNIEYLQPQTIQVSTLQEAREERNLEALDITTTSFSLTWSRLSGDTGTYVVEYSPLSDPRKKLQKTMSVEETTMVLSTLTPNTTYQVTLIPDSNNPNIQPETIQVSTLPDYIQARNLQILDITSTSFNATWSKLIGDTGRYFLDYSLLFYPRRKTRKTLYGEQTSVVVSGLTPNTTYQVTFIPESKLEAPQSQTLSVSTLPDMIQARNLQVHDITSRSLHLTWSRIEGDTGYYRVHYALASQPDVKSEMSLYGESRAAIGNLRPNTTYQITLIPQSNLQYIHLQTIEITTLPEHTQTRNLQARDMTSTGFLLTWSRLHGDEGRYVLEYVPVSDPEMTQQKIVYGDETSVVVSGLRPETTYQVTLIPEYSANYTFPEVIMVSTHSAPVQERHLQAINITARSFLLTWSRPPGDRGRYIVEYSPVLDPRGKLQKTLSMDASSEMFTNLTPNTTYLVSLIHESGAHYGTIQVSTLIDPVKARNLHVQDRKSNSLQLSWSRLAGDTGRYVLEYAPVIDLSKTIQNVLYRGQTSVIFHNLTPDTVYQVTFVPDSRGQYNQKQNITVSTLPELNQKRSVYVRDITTTSFQLAWSRMPGDQGPYVVELELISDPRRKLRKTLPHDQTNIIFSHLSPETKYRATVFSEANIQYVPPQNIQVSTLEEQHFPAHILISDPSAHSFRVSWGPSPESVAGYLIQYGPIPSNTVRTLQVDSKVNSTILENLKSNTTYLVTVSAILKSGGEKSLSAIACTEHDDTRVKYLHFNDLGDRSVKATWGSADGDVQGYRVRCRRQAGSSSVISVAPQTHSVYLTDLAEGTMNKICVMPVYKNGEGKNLCRKIQMQPGTSANGYSRI